LLTAFQAVVQRAKLRQENFRPQLRALDDRLKRREEAEEIDLDLRLVVVAGNRRHALVWTQPLRRAKLFALVQQSCRRLELLMFEEPAHERVARIVFLTLDP